MRITELGINGAWLLESPLFHDSRGFFREWFKQTELETSIGKKFEPKQANMSESSKGTLRGIHYSLGESGQAKLVTCISGAIKDCIVDIRLGSKTFGKWIDIELSAGSGRSIYLEENLGHAFLSLSENTTVSYLVSTPYAPEDEYTINPLDEYIGIAWDLGTMNLKISEKDKSAPSLIERQLEGKLPRGVELGKK
jgi:dTDP-4-dehydrorhamnose 3,5-epimerase